MKKRDLRAASWYPHAVAICIGVALYVFLTRFPQIWSAFRAFLGFFQPVIIGCAIAYIVNPLAKFFERHFRLIKNAGTRRVLSNVLAFLLVIIFLVFTMLILVPQLIDSGNYFVSHLDGYVKSVNQLLENWGVNKTIDLSGIVDSTENLLNAVSEYIANNYRTVLSVSTSVGKEVFSTVISFILSIYLLLDKPKLKSGFRRLLRALCGDENRYAEASQFLHKCDTVCSRYIIYNLIDSLIVGGVNAVFMTVVGMEYVGLISFSAAITNLVPTFGPMVGMVIGGFILLMVNPVHALIFIIFSLVLQTCDAYVIKPRLFGTSLGVSGLWIMVGVIAGGNMFGMVGILLAVPAVAILDFIYQTAIIPRLEKKSAAVPRDPGKGAGHAPEPSDPGRTGPRRK